MISRFLLLCAYSQVFLLAASSDNVLEDHTNNSVSTEAWTTQIITENIWTKEETEKNNEIRRNNRSNHVQHPWYSNVPLLPIIFASSSTLPDGPCKVQAQRYLTALRNGTLWATQMYDASTKYPDGLINGHTRHFGDFDGCYNLEVKLPAAASQNGDKFNEEEEISGRYCLVDIKYEKQNLPTLRRDEDLDLEFDPNDSAWEAIREKGDFRRVKRYLLQMALCVPEVCSHSDVEAALRGPMKTFGIETEMNLDVSVKPQFCQARKDAPEFSLAAKIYSSILLGLITLVVVSTWYDFTLEDYNENVTSTAKDLVLCFSARRNFNSIIEITSGHRGLDTLHLTRFFFLTLTMVGHRTVQYFTGPVLNIQYMESLYKYKAVMLVVAGPQTVESFFGIGGLLLTYSLLTELDAKRKINFLGLIIIRFIRLTPSYILIIFFNALILPYLGSGPYWEWKVGLERDACWNNWWANILYINNYIDPEHACMFQSWYLAVDYHLYIIAIPAIYIFWRMPRKFGYSFFTVIILGGCIIPFIYTYVYDVQPLYKGLLYMQEVRDDPYFTGHYIVSHERITSYFIGVLIGAIIYDHTRAPWQLGKVSSNILFFFVVVVLSLGTEITGHEYYNPNSNPTSLNKAIYACLHRGLFALAICSISLLITVGQGLEFHYNFLTPNWAQPLGRLTYGAYLVHTIIQLYDVGVTRSPRDFAILHMLWDYIPDVAFTFFLALLISLVVEGPFRRIEKRFILKRVKSSPSTKSEGEEKKIN
ncbi:nose resistant to fluoxetine protein 6-like [Venturia canescens]|uniref:nose resistant to fluoxetine protein 6-like n=1 Tax=Venturia canescens TaxID=32260 RepID=UPI001C9C1102|nr:nose resistant to fluoxetine protein 6-like [Venturia canescens]